MEPPTGNAPEPPTDGERVGDEPFDHPRLWHPDADVSIGPVAVPRSLVRHLEVRRWRQGQGIRRSAVVVLDASAPSQLPHWHNRDDLVLTLNGNRVFTGLIERSARLNNSLVVLVHDHFRLMEVSRFKSLALAGITPQEAIDLILRLGGWPADKIKGLTTERKQRPFFFAIPLKGARWTSGAPVTMRLGQDMFLFCHDSECLKPVKAHADEGKPYVEAHPEWRDEVPKLGGVVMATGFPEARLAALERAQVAHDFLTSALHLTQSRIGMPDSPVTVTFEAEWDRSEVRLTDSLFLHDVAFKSDRYIVFDGEPVPNDVPLDLATCPDRLHAVQRLLEPVVREGRYVPPGQEDVSKDDKRLLGRYQRALRWLTIGRAEVLPGDALLAYRFALETLLGTITYPSIFEGPNEAVRTYLAEQIKTMPLPEGATLSRDVLASKLLRADPPFMEKLRHLCGLLAVNLSDEDLRLVSRLNRRRGETVHGAARDAASHEEVQRLEHILERLLFSAAALYVKNHPVDIGWGLEPIPE